MDSLHLIVALPLYQIPILQRNVHVYAMHQTWQKPYNNQQQKFSGW